MKNSTIKLVVGLLAAVSAISPWFSGVALAEDEATPMLDAALPTISGPKRTVAVSFFGSTTNFSNQYGLTDIGGGLAAMLTTALVESDQFIVVERSRLSSILAEQDLSGAGLTEADGSVEIGRLLGAQYLIMGEVTEFSEQAKGGGFSIGIGNSDSRLALSPRKSVATVGLDIRIVDTNTAEVIESFQIREEIKARSVALNLEKDGITLGHSQFAKTPLGQVARLAINDVAQRFAETAAGETWRGSVVDFDEFGMAINAGSQSGIQTGDRFRVQRVAKVLTDPETGRVLGKRAYVVGDVEITFVEDEIAFGEFVPAANVEPRRGDVVTLL